MEQQVIDPQWRELNATKRDILMALARGGPANGADIHRRLRGHEPQTEGTTHRNIQWLTNKGLITRDPVNDKAYQCELSEDGVALLRRGVLKPAAEINAEWGGE
jgi:predicted transcriptional regulator